MAVFAPDKLEFYKLTHLSRRENSLRGQIKEAVLIF